MLHANLDIQLNGWVVSTADFDDEVVLLGFLCFSAVVHELTKKFVASVAVARDAISILRVKAHSVNVDPTLLSFWVVLVSLSGSPADYAVARVLLEYWWLHFFPFFGFDFPGSLKQPRLVFLLRYKRRGHCSPQAWSKRCQHLG